MPSVHQPGQQPGVKMKYKNDRVYIDSVASLISKPNHIFRNSSSCADLIFTKQPNLLVGIAFHYSLHYLPLSNYSL